LQALNWAVMLPLKYHRPLLYLKLGEGNSRREGEGLRPG
jgi:hypothetical protein